jgi:hypothetical protein
MIKNHQLTHKQATLAYNLVYISSLKYGLPSTALSYNQINKIQRYAVDKFISAMGIDHSTHRALIYGPSEYGGFGVRHLYTEMMGVKLETVISHLRAESELGTSIIININYLQLLAGTSKPILEPNIDISYIPMNWILHLRQFFIEINATLEIQDLWLPKQQRQHDIFIMEAFMKAKATKAELTILNNWRIYYKVLLYSELCYASGNDIQHLYTEYNHDLSSRQTKSNLNWPVQGKPDEKSFKTWKRFVRLCFTNTETKRPIPLGVWNVAEVIRVSPRKGYFHKSEAIIYIPIN